MGENEFEFEDVNFCAVNAKPYYGCMHCSFYMRPCANLIKKGDIPPCQDWKRADGRDVIFVEKQQ
jgi:hypothetical protein